LPTSVEIRAAQIEAALLTNYLAACPRNSVEQLGQIEDASFFRLAETRFAATPVAVSTALAAVVEPDELPVELSVELMSGVVAQIQSREKRSKVVRVKNLLALLASPSRLGGKNVERKNRDHTKRAATNPPRPSRQTHARGSTVK
jgi:hypothetical protein